VIRRLNFFAAALVALFAGLFAGPGTANEPLDGAALQTVRGKFERLMQFANAHDTDAIRTMFWQSPSALLVAKSAVPADGNWAGYWGNDAIDRKLRDIAASGPVALEPDLAKLKVVGLTRDVAESYAPVSITVSYAGQDGTPKPFLMILTWLQVDGDWKIASEIILPVPPTPTPKG
jgi:hypothetical protein